MEYVEGRDLLVMVKQEGPLEYAAAADYTRQAAEGLAHAHHAGLIHRDVKPANLLVDQNNVVKVLDLGLARFTDEDHASLTVAHDENVLGTADYLAPEQALDSHGVDTRADIYSLGCSLYYLLTGHPPFPDGTLPQRLMMHQKHPPPSIYDDRPDAPQDLVEICLRMMAKKPADRYQSTAEVAEVLAGWLTAHGHAVDSGSGSGSSGRLAAAAAGRGESAGGTSRRKGSPPIRRPAAKGGKPPRRIAGSGSDRPRRGPAPPLKSPASGDTVAKTDRPTVKLPGRSPSRAFTSGDSDPKVSEKQLPVAKRLEEENRVPEFLARNDSPVLDRIRAQHPMTSEEIEAYRRRRKGNPIWVWAVIGVGCVVALILAVVVLTSG